MTVTHGETMLARAERRARGRAARRRRRMLLLPASFATVWALIGLLVARHERLSHAHASAFRHLYDHVSVAAWTLLLVIVPLAVALRPRPIPAGAALAVIAGPILSPVLFGPGGWSRWQIAVVSAVAALVLLSQRERRRVERA